MVSPVYMICHAYEAGVGWGRSGRPANNPYASDPGINAQCHEAWGYGWDEGADWHKANMPAPTPETQG